MSALDLATFSAAAPRRRAEFLSATPFPHVVLDDFLRPTAADAVYREFDEVRDNWIYLHHVNERKRILGDIGCMGPVTRALIDTLQSPAFLRALEALTGVADLQGDPDLDGVGLAEMGPAGFVNVHRDFLAHTTRRRWSRQVNLLLFLNPEWSPFWGGDLEFWDTGVTRCVRAIAPVMNRCVVFRTAETAFHGVSKLVRCPPGRCRRSLALYYFHDEGIVLPLAPTLYVPRPGDSATRRALIHLDTWAIRAYTWLKRHGAVRDAWASRILRHF